MDCKLHAWVRLTSQALSTWIRNDKWCELMHALSYAAKSHMRLHAFSNNKACSIERNADMYQIDLQLTVAAFVDFVHWIELNLAAIVEDIPQELCELPPNPAGSLMFLYSNRARVSSVGFFLLRWLCLRTRSGGWATGRRHENRESRWTRIRQSHTHPGKLKNLAIKA